MTAQVPPFRLRHGRRAEERDGAATQPGSDPRSKRDGRRLASLGASLRQETLLGSSAQKALGS
jgi:hypothetical protein